MDTLLAQIFDESPRHMWIIVGQSNETIAPRAKKPTHLACLVVMIHIEYGTMVLLVFAVAYSGIHRPTNSTPIALLN